MRLCWGIVLATSATVAATSGCSSSGATEVGKIRDVPTGRSDGGDAGREAAARDSAVERTSDREPSTSDAAGAGTDASEEIQVVVRPDGASPLCSPTATWGAAMLLPISTDEARFAAVTPDELTIAWISTFQDIPILHYADRASGSDPFGDDLTLAGTADYFAADRVAMSPDGLRIVVVRIDRKGFGEFTRSARFTDFTLQPSEDAFAAINAFGAQTLADGESLGDPILSADDESLFFSRYGGDQNSSIYESVRTGVSAWPVGGAVTGEMLKVEERKRRRPTGISADRRTLFYWDETSLSERAASRVAPDWPFETMFEVGDYPEAQPNGSCTNLYFSVVTAGRSDVFVAPLN